MRRCLRPRPAAGALGCVGRLAAGVAAAASPACSSRCAHSPSSAAPVPPSSLVLIVSATPQYERQTLSSSAGVHTDGSKTGRPETGSLLKPASKSCCMGAQSGLSTRRGRLRAAMSA